MSRLALLSLGVGLALAAAPSAQAQPEGLPLDVRPEGRRPSYPGQLGRIGAGVTLAGVTRGALKGDTGAVSDALNEPLTPEFLISIATFDASLRASGAIASRIPLEGRVANALKGNLAMAAAITLAGAVEVDLNGFTYSDALSADFEKLADASVGLRPVDAEGVATTVGSFAAGSGIWTGIKRAGGIFGRSLGRRLIRTAAVKGVLAVAPVPGTRVAAALLTAGEVALAVADLAAILVIGGEIEEEVREVRAAQRAESAIEAARRTLTERVRAGGDVREALAGSAGAFDEDRNRRFQELALQDLALVRRLRRDGTNPAQLEALAQGVFDDYGTRLGLPAQTAALIEAYGEDRAGHVERQQARARRIAAERAQVYRNEAALYRALRAEATDLGTREQLLRAAEEVEALASIEEELFARIQRPSFSTPAPVAPARTSVTQALEQSSEGWDD